MSSKMLNILRLQLLSRYRNYSTMSVASMQGCKYFCTKNEPNTVGEALKHWSHCFENEGISEPVESIEHILAHVLGTKKYRHVPQIMDLADASEQRLSLEQVIKLESLCQCRMSRMPVQYIIGEWDFRDITLKMVPPVFIPRPETEILVDIILKHVAAINKENLKLLDIGCGSGAISLALVHANSKIQCTSVDKSLYACELTAKNAEDLGLRDKVKIFNAVLEENGTLKLATNDESAVELENAQFDMIVSNPPYVPTGKLLGLAPEIKIYEDLRALDGGQDGLNLIKAVMKYASKALIPRGLVFMEVDPTHPEYIEFFTKKYSDLNLKLGHTYKDYCNNDRFVEILKSS